MLKLLFFFVFLFLIASPLKLKITSTNDTFIIKIYYLKIKLYSFIFDISDYISKARLRDTKSYVSDFIGFYEVVILYEDFIKVLNINELFLFVELKPDIYTEVQTYVALNTFINNTFEYISVKTRNVKKQDYLIEMSSRNHINIKFIGTISILSILSVIIVSTIKVLYSKFIRRIDEYE